MNIGSYHVSVDAPFSNGDDNNLLDILPNKDLIPTDNQLVEESMLREIDRVLDTLSSRERLVIKAYFGLDQQEMSLEEIGEKTGLTRERVRQIKEKAIRHLRQNNISKELKAYLGQ